jgi:20S proteasome alpha/beta subunit
LAARWQNDNLLNCGTTLIAATTADGIVMAADDLMYAEQSGQAIPLKNGFHKVFVADKNILIGSAALMLDQTIEYQFEDWITEFIETQQGTLAFKRPSDIAAALEIKTSGRHTAQESGS